MLTKLILGFIPAKYKPFVKAGIAVYEKYTEVASDGKITVEESKQLADVFLTVSGLSTKVVFKV